jgi:hypothetical protein
MRKRAAIQVVYEQLGSPPEADWDGADGVAVEVRTRLKLPPTQTETRGIKRVLDSILEGDVDFDASDTTPFKRQRKLSEGQAKVAADCLVSGFGQWQAMHNVNVWRRKKGFSPVSRSCVRDSAFLIGARKFRRGTAKSGKTDEESVWAKARLAQALQIKAQLAPRVHAVRVRGFVAQLPHIELAQVLWTDEKHSKCHLGCASKYEYQLPQGPGGKYRAVTDGGEYPERMPTTAVKFPKEARFCLGVMKKLCKGKYVGFKTVPYEYTGKKMIGVAKFRKLWDNEILRVADLKGQWAQYSAVKAARLEGGRYKLRWPGTWCEELRGVLGRGEGAVVCVTDEIDHMVAEGKRLFAGTPYARTWILQHDALSQFWEEGAQEYLASLGFGPSRQICAQGDTNVGTRYEGKLPGDTPELEPLDSNLFSDLEYGMKQHVAITSDLALGDPNKFSLGTPAEVSDTLRRTWQVAPTPERIVQDIDRYPKAIDAIIAAKGAKVPELDNRRGRRATRAFQPHPGCGAAIKAREAKWALLDP